MDRNNIIESGGFYFIHNFDSGNLGHVERVPTDLIVPSNNLKTNGFETPDYEFNLWTRPDCAGTEFENGNRTWFYFGVQASEPNVLVRLNLINLNKQGKMYNQGMAPVTRTLPGRPQWERIKDRPVHSTDDNAFTLSFKYRTSDNTKATTFFAFTYPFSFAELQIGLNTIDSKLLPLKTPATDDEIYYCRECLIYSLEGRRVDLLTISSYHGITNEREDRLKNLFPDKQERPFKFSNKKVIFISARVHPGETPSSFVFNGFLNLLLNKADPVAVQLRKHYVFKMIPFLNPDGVARGHYRTDTRGVNLNRVYLNPSLLLHPTVYAARALIRYYHFGCEKEDNCDDAISISNLSENVEQIEIKKKSGSRANSSNLKNTELRKSNKSTTTIKPASQDVSQKGLSGDATNLVEQVYDMKIQEMQSQTSDVTLPHTEDTSDCPSLLTDNVLRNCLGSTVHVSTSEELNLHGGNPLRPLRDTLKNSISLLMESSSSVTGDSVAGGGGGGGGGGVRVGWCAACRRGARRLERGAPGAVSRVPGYSASLSRSDSPTKYDSIEEYREHQRQMFDEREKKQDATGAALDAEEGDQFFCSNCFKRYTLAEEDEEEIQLEMVPSSNSVCASAGDSGDAPPPAAPPPLAAPSEQASVLTKQEKAKSAVVRGPAKKKAPPQPSVNKASAPKEPDSGLFLYIDLHGHASKKGIFMYGNHFPDAESSVECMLLPRIMSLNSLHFHFSSCNFTERNMYLKDRRDGMSREGSGRVAVLKATGLVRSYTLECNYNTGRLVNVLPPPAAGPPGPHGPHSPPGPHSPHTPPAPPKYTPHIFEEVGRSLGASILDLCGQHPASRVPASEHRSVAAIRDWLRAHTRAMMPQLTMSRLRPKTSSPTRAPLYARAKGKVIDERKENTYVGAKTDSERRRSPPVLAARSGHDIINMNVKITKKPEPVKTSTSRTRYLPESEPKQKSLTSKRRNILVIRKPNTTKTSVGGIVKSKVSRRSADDTESPRGSKLGKRNFSRSASRAGRGAASSSSSETAGGWEQVAGGTAVEARQEAGKRRALPAAPPAPPAALKKLRLKTAL